MTNKLIKKGLLIVLTLIAFACTKAPVIDQSEKEWLKNHPNLSIGISPNQPPYQFINEKGEINGMFIDFLTIIEDRLDYKFKKTYQPDWTRLLADSKEGKVDVVLQIQETDERKEYLNFTPFLISHKHVIVVKNTRQDISSVSDLSDKKIAVVNSFAIQGYLLNNYPGYSVSPLYDNVTGLRAVSTGQADAFITQQAVATYYIETEGISNLKIAGEIDYPNELGIASRKNLDTLNIILSKAVNSITKTEKQNIYNQWLSIEVKPFYAEAKFWIVILVVILVVLTFVILFNLALRARVKQKTSELKAAKEKVEENEERYRTLMLNIETGIVVHSPDTSILMNNSKALELLGVSEDQMKGKAAIDPAWKFVTENNMPLPLEDYPANRIVSNKKPIRNQVLGIHQSGNNDVVWALVNGFPVLNDNGEIIEIIISFIDITERKKAEQYVLESQAKLSKALEESNQSRQLLLSVLEDQLKAQETLRETNDYLESLFNFTTAPIVVWDPSLKITRFNRAFEQLSGFDVAEVIGQPVSIFFPEDQVQSSLSLINKTAGGEKWDSVEIEILRKDKKTKIVVWNSSNIFDKAGKTIIATIALGYDITERKHAEEKIQVQLDELRRWYDVTLDREGRVLQLKQEVNELLKQHGEALRYGSDI